MKLQTGIVVLKMGSNQKFWHHWKALNRSILKQLGILTENAVVLSYEKSMEGWQTAFFRPYKYVIHRLRVK